MAVYGMLLQQAKWQVLATSSRMMSTSPKAAYLLLVVPL